MGGSHVLARQFHVADDRRHDVVEVVRDAAGERAQRLHLLRFAQLAFDLGPRRLGPPAFGDVAHESEQALPECGHLQHADLDVDDGPVLAPVPGGKARSPGLYHLLRARRDLLGRFVGVDIPDAHAQQFGPRVSQLAADGIVGVEDASEEIRDPETVDRRLDDGAILVFVALALGDVARHALDGDQLAGVVENRQIALLGPDDGAVFLLPAQLQRLVGRRFAFGKFLEQVAVVRVNHFPAEIGVRVMLLGRVAGDVDGCGADKGKAALRGEIVAVDQVRRVFRQTPEALFAAAQRFGRQLALGDVAENAHQYRLIVHPYHLGQHFNRYLAAVGTQHFVFDRVGEPEILRFLDVTIERDFRIVSGLGWVQLALMHADDGLARSA